MWVVTQSDQYLCEEITPEILEIRMSCYLFEQHVKYFNQKHAKVVL